MSTATVTLTPMLPPPSFQDLAGAQTIPVQATELRELFALPSAGGAPIIGRYSDSELFDKYAAELNAKGYHIYELVNPLKETADRVPLNQPPASQCRADGTEIARRAFLPYDVDAVRPGGAATNQELAAAKEMAKKIVTFWEARGIDAGVIHSGNGFQLRVSIDLPADTSLVAKILKIHAYQFHTEGAKLDCLGDAPRVFRVPGYLNWKGDNSPDRPRRTVRLLREHKGIASVQQLQEIVDSAPKEAFLAQGSSTTGTADVSALAVLKDAYHQRGEFEDLLGLGLHLDGDHPTMVSLASYLYNSWEEDRENEMGDLIDIIERVWDEYGASSDGGRQPNEVRSIVQHLFSNRKRLQLSREPDNLEYVNRDYLYSVGCKPGDRSSIRCCIPFSNETDFSIFKNRCEKTPAWAIAPTWDGEDPTTLRWPGYDAWKTQQPKHVDGEFKFPSVPGEMLEFVLNPKDEYDGWFMRGCVSLVGGSSGAGKTSAMCVLLEKQWKREIYFGHVGAGLLPLILFADRGSLSNRATLRRLGMERTEMPLDHLPVAWGLEAAKKILDRIERQDVLPETVFIEGADVLVEDPNKSQVVAPFLAALQRIAAHYHLAIVLSVGAPKGKPKEKHTLQRDRIFGSQVWPRMAETVITMEPVGDGTGSRRTLSAQHRNAASEKFELEFISGRLMEVAPDAVEECDALLAWIRGLEGKRFTRDEAVAAMKTGETDMKRTAVYDRIKTLLSNGRLRKGWNNTRRVQELWTSTLAQDFKGTIYESPSEEVCTETA